MDSEMASVILQTSSASCDRLFRRSEVYIWHAVIWCRIWFIDESEKSIPTWVEICDLYANSSSYIRTVECDLNVGKKSSYICVSINFELWVSHRIILRKRSLYLRLWENLDAKCSDTSNGNNSQLLINVNSWLYRDDSNPPITLRNEVSLSRCANQCVPDRASKSELRTF